MIAYQTVGVTDLERAGKFYDGLFSEMGSGRLMQNERMIIWANTPGAPMFGVCLPFDGETCSAGNGTMTALPAKTPAQVSELFLKALNMGAKSEGEPGPRAGGSNVMAYVRDPDGNKLAFACLNMSG